MQMVHFEALTPLLMNWIAYCTFDIFQSVETFWLRLFLKSYILSYSSNYATSHSVVVTVATLTEHVMTLTVVVLFKCQDAQ